jgi:hypothetical protein
MHACMYVVLCLTASNATRPPSVHGSRSRALISSPLPSHTPKLELHACSPQSSSARLGVSQIRVGEGRKNTLLV